MIERRGMMIIGQLALPLSASFTAAAFCVNVVEQPARLGLDEPALLAEWKVACRRGFALQAPLAFLGFALGTLVWYCTGQLLFFIGVLLMIANWPWTLLIMMPTNKKIMGTPLEEAGPETRDRIVKWNGLHATRTFLGCLAVFAFLLALVR
jgi:Anthrone oxygenase